MIGCRAGSGDGRDASVVSQIATAPIVCQWLTPKDSNRRQLRARWIANEPFE